MVIFLTYEKLCEYINHIPKYTKKNGLEHTKELLSRVGNPEQKFKVIHVAGSNGKGSVCAFINQVLTQAGKKTGLFTSPHLICMEERFRINSKNCTQEDFSRVFHQVLTVVQEMQRDGYAHPAFFEFLFAMGMLLFAQEEVEYAVLETGLGGRLDATNVIPSPIMTVITSISLEHTEILGDTIAEIAAEKAGIIKHGIPVVYDAGNAAADEVIRKTAGEKQAPAFRVDPKKLSIHEITGKNIDFCICNRYDVVNLKIPFAAKYQMINAALAYQVMALLREEIGIDAAMICKAMEQTVWPGRMQEAADGIYFDGAHNVQGMEAFAETVSRIGGERPILVFSMVQEKDYHKTVQILADSIKWDKVIITKIMDERGLEPEVLAELFTSRGVKTEIIRNSLDAFTFARQQKREDQRLFCAGSLYLIGELQHSLGGISHD